MRLLDTGTKYFDRYSYGVPKLENTWGCMIDFLDTVLVNGSETQEILSTTVKDDPIYPEHYWLIELFINPNHGFKSNLSVVEISEASNPTYNGIFRVQDTTINSITIAFSKIDHPIKPLNLEYTFGITLKSPALGYEKIYAAPQKAVYKVNTKDDKSCYLRVDNSCPLEQDPSHMKFSRVSMFEYMDHIDDYTFKQDRKKAPANTSNYNLVEEGIQNVWFNTTVYNNTGVVFKTTPDSQKFYCLFGDSSTFYLHWDSLRRDSVATEDRDETYCFGKYEKLIYKEDPLPFILRCSRRENLTSSYFTASTEYSSITRDRDYSNYTFNTEEHRIFELPKHDKFALWLNDSFSSGSDTRLNYKPYKNELSMNIFDMNLRFFRPGNTVLEGRYRGIKSIMNNLKDYPAKRPPRYTTFSQEDKFYLMISDRDRYDTGESCYAVELTDWRDL